MLGCSISGEIPWTPRSLGNFFEDETDKDDCHEASPSRAHTSSDLTPWAAAAAFRSKTGGRMDLDSAYELLGYGLDEMPHEAEVQRRYRELQRRNHPDKAGEEATEMAALLNQV